VRITRNLSRILGGIPVRSIGFGDLESWKIERAPKLSPRSFNYERDTLRQMFEYARLNLNIILENPVDAIKKRKMEKPHILIASKEQFRVLLSTLRAAPRARQIPDFVEFLAYSGLRLNEARQVRWVDVNFDLNALVVTGGEHGTKNHEFRSIPLSPPLRRLLEKLRQQSKGKSKDRIFGLNSATKSLEAASKKASLPHFTHHSMRHFFCSNAIEAGCDFKVIAEWLGHKDGGILVAQTYGHLRNEHSTAMAKRLTFDAEAENEVAFDEAKDM